MARQSIVLLVALARLGAFAAAQDICKFRNTDKTGSYDLNALKSGPGTLVGPHRFYNGNDHYIYTVNFCGAPACAYTGNMPTPGCQQSPASQVGVTAIGTYQEMRHTEINTGDVTDINFKTKNQPTFPAETKGVKLYYPGTQGGWPQPQAPPTPPAWPGRQWPSSRSTSDRAMTVLILCNPKLTKSARPVLFAPGMEYKTRDGGFMFAIEHAAGCICEITEPNSTKNYLTLVGAFGIGLAIFLAICGILYRSKCSTPKPQNPTRVGEVFKGVEYAEIRTDLKCAEVPPPYAARAPPPSCATTSDENEVMMEEVEPNLC